ncbi:MAG: macro domain-containing protein [Lewinellaceae bacterium]|nr:macro domain-containing protein [Lewinellaceae bacterium]
MIRYTQGNLLTSEAQALVNTVNTMGVMGKGIALQFKEAYPENFRLYKKACDAGELEPGKLLITRERNALGEKIIINFPTKTKWWLKSSYRYIEDGLKALVEAIQQHAIQSVAIPPLGCGNGGLQWKKVRGLIEQYLSDSPAEIIVYEPHPNIKQELRQSTKAKAAKLTPARAMLLYALFQYERQGEAASLFVANKLAYFLQRMGEPLRLKFVPHFYGPYSPQVQHVLYYLNNVYLHGLEQQNVRPFEALQLNYSHYEEVEKFLKKNLGTEQHARLQNLIRLIEGFESTYALEILATVDYILAEHPDIDEEGLLKKAQEWSSRKTRLLKPDYVRVARERIRKYNSGTIAPLFNSSNSPTEY